MYEIHRSSNFRKSFKRVSKSGSFDLSKFEYIISLLSSRQQLPLQFRDHELKGDYSGLRECHIKGDCLLIYNIDDDERVIFLVDIGNHANLFE